MTVALDRYLLAHFAKSQFWHTSGLLFAFFLTEACGMSASTMGIVLAMSLAINGLVDWQLGRYWRTSVGDTATALRLQARCAPLAALAFLLFCATPAIDADARLWWAVATLFAFRLTYPLIDVPQNAMVALASPAAATQMRWLAARNMVSAAAGLSVSLMAAPLLLYAGDDTPYLIWAVAAAGFVCLTAWWLGRAPLCPVPVERPSLPVARFEPPFIIILAALAAMMVASTFFRAMEPYFAAFASDGIGLLVAGSIGTIVSQPLWMLCERRTSARNLFLIAAMVSLLAAMALLSPLRSSPLGVIIVGAGFGIGSGGLWLMLWGAMMARASRGHATHFVGAFTCVSKLAQSAAMLILGTALSLTPYRDALRETLSLPSLLMVAGLMVITLVCVLLATVGSGSRRSGQLNMVS